MKVATTRAVVCLSILLTVYQVNGFHVPAKMNRTIHNLLNHYKIPPRDLLNGHPVFSKDLVTSNMDLNTRRMILGSVLETYERLLSQMLRQIPTPSPLTSGSKDHLTSGAIPSPGNARVPGSEASGDVRKGLSDILEMVQNLRKHHYPYLDTFLQSLHSLRHIQMDNAVVQNKALSELPLLYDEASSLSEIQMERRRKRRQTRRRKTQQRA